MRHRIAALTGAGMIIAALGTVAPAAARAQAASLWASPAASAAAQASTTCGTWRWPVKTGSDATRYQVSRTTRYTGVNYLDSLTPPSSFGSYARNHRIRWPEFRAQLRPYANADVKALVLRALALGWSEKWRVR